MSNYIVIVSYKEIDVYIRKFEQNNSFKEMEIYKWGKVKEIKE